MITEEEVAGLQKGDVVELAFASGSVIRGPLTMDHLVGGLEIADVGWSVRRRDGSVGYWAKSDATLTVVSRAPRLYVNHDRTEPFAGDVVRNADDDGSWVAMRDSHGRWVDRYGRSTHPAEMPDRLHLLVDGTTGQAVQ